MVGAPVVQDRPNPQALSEGLHSEAQPDFKNQLNKSIHQNYVTSCKAARGVRLVVASGLLLGRLMGL